MYLDTLVTVARAIVDLAVAFGADRAAAIETVSYWVVTLGLY